MHLDSVGRFSDGGSSYIEHKLSKSAAHQLCQYIAVYSPTYIGSARGMRRFPLHAGAKQQCNALTQLLHLCVADREQWAAYIL